MATINNVLSCFIAETFFAYLKVCWKTWVELKD